ncbi:MAG: hypothetical protein H0W86_11200, partial [Armatimonadetes bacterium]|nr:hypothetical protein [Armatimonadota bacterium]
MAAVVDEWVQESPIPVARNLTGVAWATSTHGFASGEYFTLIETFDGGVTWRNVNLGVTPNTNPFYNVYCTNANTCFVTGTSATTGSDQFRTADGGVSWQRITPFPFGSWSYIDFVSPTVGFMGANGAAAKTTNSGVTWTSVSNSTCPVMYSMDFKDTSVGLCGGTRVSGADSGPGIFKTTDGGATWTKKLTQASNAVVWMDSTTAVAIVGTSIYRSTNTGDTWTSISNQVTTGFVAMDLTPNGTLVGVSGLGDAWRSTDGGFNWTKTLVGKGALASAWNVSFFGDQIGTIVGQGGWIFKTTDGGLTWTQLNSGIGGVSFLDLEMFDETTGLAVGDNGYFLRTTDGGARWDVGRLQVTGVVLFRNESLKAISIVDQDFAAAVGYDGVAYKTFDRGQTWESIGYPVLSEFLLGNDIKFVTRDIGYIAGVTSGVQNDIFKTTNGGITWTTVNVAAGGFVDFADVNHGWVMNIGGLGYRTLDGGNSWIQFALPSGMSLFITKMDFVNQNVGWVVGWDGYAARTTNGGISWTILTIDTPDETILGLHAVSETEAYAVGVHRQPSAETAAVFHTTNSGATWTKTFIPAISLSGVFGTPAGNAWVSGYDGAVFHKAGASTGTLQLTSAVSRKTQRNAGTFDVNLPLAGAAGVECRDGLGRYSFVFNFASNVVSGTASVTGGTGTAGAPTFSGTTMTVPLSGVTDVQTLTVTLNGVTDSTGAVLPSTAVSAKILISDVNG